MPSFLDEINRLFDELVHEAWRGTPVRRREPPGPSVIELQVPVAGARRSDIAFTIEGGRVTVTVRRHDGGPLEGAEEEFQHSLMLPPGTEPAAVEAHFEGDTLRIRVSLRAPVKP